MARGQKDKLYRTFNKGLITEAGFLTYPEDASTDELNTVLYRKGNRSRRLGINFEEDATGFTGQHTFTKDATVETYLWKAPGNEGDLNFVVVQVDGRLHFFDASVAPMDSGKKTFTADIGDFKAPTATSDEIAATPVAMTSGKGILFVASEHIDPFTVEYDPKTDTIKAIRIRIMMRDFDGINDNLANDSEPTNLSKEHYYNLRNQGWVPPGTPSTQGSVPDDTGTTTPPPPPPETPPEEVPEVSAGEEGVAYNPYTGERYYYTRRTNLEY